MGPGELAVWAARQLQVAQDILDNPGGGLVFASQTMGQVRAALSRADPDAWRPAVEALLEAEDAAVHRDFAASRRHLGRARELLSA